MYQLSDENKKLLVNGAKSLAWRTGAFAFVGALNLVLSLELPAQVQLVAGLLVGELTKYLNKKYQLGKARTEVLKA